MSNTFSNLSFLGHLPIPTAALILLFSASAPAQESVRLYVAVDLSRSVDQAGLTAANEMLQNGGDLQATLARGADNFKLVGFAGVGTQNEPAVVPLDSSHLDEILREYRKQSQVWPKCGANGQMNIFQIRGQVLNVCKSDFRALFKGIADFFRSGAKGQPNPGVRNIVWLFSDGQDDPNGEDGSGGPPPIERLFDAEKVKPFDKVDPFDLVLVYSPGKSSTKSWQQVETAWDGAIEQSNLLHDQTINFTFESNLYPTPNLYYEHLKEELVERMINGERGRVQAVDTSCYTRQSDDKRHIHLVVRVDARSTYDDLDVVAPVYTMSYQIPPQRPSALCGGNQPPCGFGPYPLKRGYNEISNWLTRQDLSMAPNEILVSFKVQRPKKYHWEEKSLVLPIRCGLFSESLRVSATIPFEGVNLFYRPIGDHPFSVQLESTFEGADGRDAELAPVAVYDDQKVSDETYVECDGRKVPRGYANAIIITATQEHPMFDCKVYGKSGSLMPDKLQTGLTFVYPGTATPVNPVIIGSSRDGRTMAPDKWPFFYIGPVLIAIALAHAISAVVVPLEAYRRRHKAGLKNAPSKEEGGTAARLECAPTEDRDESATAQQDKQATKKDGIDVLVGTFVAVWVAALVVGGAYLLHWLQVREAADLWPSRIRVALWIYASLVVVGGAMLWKWEKFGPDKEKRRCSAVIGLGLVLVVYLLPLPSWARIILTTILIEHAIFAEVWFRKDKWGPIVKIAMPPGLHEFLEKVVGN